MPVSERPSPLERDILRVVEQWARPTGSIEDWSWPHGASAVYKVRTDRGDVVVDFDTWSARAQQLVAPQDLDAAREIASAACHLGTVELVPAHCDNTPRNWMVDDGNAVSLVDFGLAKKEPWWADVHRLMHREWLGRADLRDAFLAGYGRDIDDSTADFLRAYGACAAVSTIVWATEHGDRAFAGEGYAQLRGLLGRGC